MADVFNAYDEKGEGLLNYKEFSALITRGDASSISEMSDSIT